MKFNEHRDGRRPTSTKRGGDRRGVEVKVGKSLPATEKRMASSKSLHRYRLAGRDISRKRFPPVTCDTDDGLACRGRVCGGTALAIAIKGEHSSARPGTKRAPSRPAAAILDGRDWRTRDPAASLGAPHQRRPVARLVRPAVGPNLTTQVLCYGEPRARFRRSGAARVAREGTPNRQPRAARQQSGQAHRRGDGHCKFDFVCCAKFALFSRRAARFFPAYQRARLRARLHVAAGHRSFCGRSSARRHSALSPSVNGTGRSRRRPVRVGDEDRGSIDC